MLKNNIRIFYRLLAKQKSFYLINVAGLTTGIACFLIILIYVNYENSFDTFHHNGSKIYRIASGSSRTPIALAPAAQAQVAGVEKSVRFIFPGINAKLAIADSTGEMYEEFVYFADSAFFEMFTYTFVEGTPASFSKGDEGVVITRRIAEKYFGTAPAVDNIIRFKNAGLPNENYTVLAVIENPPANSQFHFDIVLPFSHYGANNFSENWAINLIYSFIQLTDHADVMQVENEVRNVIQAHTQMSQNEIREFRLQPFRTLHFDNSTTFDYGPHGKKENMLMLIGVAVVILIIGSINFINLSTAKALDRVKEIGLRKTVGASRIELIQQFLSESFFISFLSFFLSIPLVAVVEPVFSELTGISLGDAVGLMGSAGYLVLLLPFALGLLSGFYPAYSISAFKPVESFKGLSAVHSKTTLRLLLVTLQFGITAFMLNSTFIVRRQIEFINHTSLGFDRDHILVIQGEDGGVGGKLDVIRQAFMTNKNVINVSAALTVPGQYAYTMPYSISETIAGDDSDDSMSGMYVDQEFISNMNIKLLRGRTFSKNILSDTLSFLINEEAHKHLIAKYGEDWRDPIGKKLNYFRANTDSWFVAKRGTVIGIVQDFNFASLHEPVRPLVIQVDEKLFYKVIVKISPANMPETLAFLKNKWRELVPNYPFSYFFLDEQFGRAYERDRNFERMLTVFSIVSILVSCLGLYGLVLFSTLKRSREIGIRKVVGAGSLNISFMLAKNFVRPVMIAFAVVSPLSFWGMSQWLEQFAYHTTIDWAVFLLSGTLCVSIAVLTISYQTIKAGYLNPLKFLRD